MTKDFIETAKKEIVFFLKNNYSSVKFTVKFNGEFFIAAADKELPREALPCFPDLISAFETQGNKILLYLSEEWLEYAVSNIGQAQCTSKNLPMYSQIKRLDSQLEFGIYGGSWNESMYPLAKNILYFIHTKSSSIRQNVVKKCEREYNILQRHGLIPKEIIMGYRNALCQIGDKL